MNDTLDRPTADAVAAELRRFAQENVAPLCGRYNETTGDAVQEALLQRADELTALPVLDAEVVDDSDDAGPGPCPDCESQDTAWSSGDPGDDTAHCNRCFEGFYGAVTA
jgi:hypothetical protein